MLTVVIAVHNEVESLPAVLTGLHAVLSAHTHEILIVDDGSNDGTGRAAEEFIGRHPEARLIRLARNYGQTTALAAGLDAARGDIIVTMDGDGQNDPGDIPRLLAALGDGADVASGWRQERKDPLWARRLPSWAANRLISWVTGVRLKDYGCMLKAYRREVLSDLALYGEMHRLIPIWCAWRGARIVEVPVRHHPRRGGRSHYGLGRTFRVMIDLLTAKFFYSYLGSPAHILGGVGLCLLALGMLAGLFPFLDKFVFEAWGHLRIPFMILSVFLGLLGIQFLGLGILAEIMIRILYRNHPIHPYRTIPNAPNSSGNPLVPPAGRASPPTPGA